MHNRRKFIQVAGASIVAGQAASTYANIKGSNAKLRFAVVGFRGRGKNLIEAIRASDDAELVALCDVDKDVLGSVNPTNKKLVRTSDFRELLDRDDIDVIASATPNHWHTAVAMHGVLSGKHVYIEKPISHNMFESQQVVAAADKTGKLIQCGFQNRSDTGLTTFYQQLHNGDYGKVLAVHGTCHRKRDSIGKLDSQLKVGANINYDMWLGPAADQPLMRPKLHYDWHWDFNTGNGDVGNQGPHEWDLMNWALGNPEELPTTMVAAGNRFGWGDAGNTPNVMACMGMVGEIPIFFEVMDLKSGRGAPHGRGVGVIIETEKGKFVGGRGGGKFIFSDGKTENFSRDKSQKGDGTHFHMQNFIDCVMNDNRSGLASDCSVAARSSSMAHMANISFQLGKEAKPEQLESAFGASVQGRDMLARLRESTFMYAMSKDQTSVEPWIMGQPLTYNNQENQFDSADANRKMTRDYRTGYELPSLS